MMNLYPAPNANNASAGYNFVNTPVRQLNDTRFDTRLDYTLSDKDNLFGRFSYEQAFSYVPGGSTPPAFASANAFGTNQHIINHARNVAPWRDPCVLRQRGQPGQLWLQPHLRLHHFARHGDLRVRQHRARRHSQRQPRMPRPAPACLAHTAADWFRQSSLAAIGPSATAATLRSRAERTSSLSETRSILIRHKHDFRIGH